MISEGLPLRTVVKLRLAMRIWMLYLGIRLRSRRRPIPEVVERIGGSRTREPAVPDARRLGRIVDRVLRHPLLGSRCLERSLVLYALLREGGARAELVVGLPVEAEEPDAHAWVEVDGLVVGPPPGRAGHEPLARYGAGRTDQ